ncbi:mechanosensitive ion channel [Candidatus Woesearchaeota archaeon]|nr:mechanosensitive ion channel [Candidatus Woesearchaeota archaeon]
MTMVSIFNSLIENLTLHWINVFYIASIIIFSTILTIFLNIFYKNLKQKGKIQNFPVKKIWLNLGVAAAAIVLILTGLPGISNNIVRLIGVVIGAIVAFSSSTLIANFMSGILLKIIEPYKEGDMVKLKNIFGKVYHIGLLHTEVQTPFREIVNVPNLVTISDIITNYTKGGYLINVDVSIGYDISHNKVEDMLLHAMKLTGLSEPFVLVTDLGSYAVKYRAKGIIRDVTKIISTESRLRKKILDEFSINDIEILSPFYVNMKNVPYNKCIMAQNPGKAPAKIGEKKPEEVMYERADKEVTKKNKKRAEKNISHAFKKIIPE